MPPNSQSAGQKVPNNKLIWKAVSNQIDFVNELKLIWNKLDHDRMIADLGVKNRNAASKRFKRWVDWVVEHSAQLESDDGETTKHAKKTNPTAKFKEKRTKTYVKKEKGVGKKGLVGKRKRTRMKDIVLTNWYIGRAKNSSDTSEDTSGDDSEESF